MIHKRKHPNHVSHCYACKLATVNLAPSATPTRRENRKRQQKR